MSRRFLRRGLMAWAVVAAALKLAVVNLIVVIV